MGVRIKKEGMDFVAVVAGEGEGRAWETVLEDKRRYRLTEVADGGLMLSVNELSVAEWMIAHVDLEFAMDPFQNWKTAVQGIRDACEAFRSDEAEVERIRRGGEEGTEPGAAEALKQRLADRRMMFIPRRAELSAVLGALRITQAELAASAGINQAVVSQFLHGTRSLKKDMYEGFLQALRHELERQAGAGLLSPELAKLVRGVLDLLDKERARVEEAQTCSGDE